MEINNVGNQTPSLPGNVQNATPGASEQASQMSQQAETALGSAFFSMLQNILGEAQSNSGS